LNKDLFNAKNETHKEVSEFILDQEESNFSYAETD